MRLSLMKILEPHYQLLDMGNHEWRFQESEEMYRDTLRFDRIWESRGGQRGLAASLRTFLKTCPHHIDALHHYAMTTLDSGKKLDGYAFAHTAVAIGRNAFPENFKRGTDRLPGGFVQNRPFLRAVHGLMLAQAALGDRISAISTGYELIGYDDEDRMEARFSLPIYLLSEGRSLDALNIFGNPSFLGTFGPTEFLHVLVLFQHGKLEKAKNALSSYLRYYPQVVKFLLNPTPTAPMNNAPLGLVTSGSEYQGWCAAQEYSQFLQKTAGAFEWLEKEFKDFTS